MDAMRVFIVNLGRYNEGKDTGEWFTLPVEPEEVKERLGLDESHEEYAIHDYELPFEIDEYESLERLNHLAELAEEFDNHGYLDDVQEMKNIWGVSFEELAEHVDDIVCYKNCEDDEDVARELLEETGVLRSLPAELAMYFDYAAYGRDLAINRNFVYGNRNIYEMGW